MSQFYAEVSGQGTTVSTRGGSKVSGMTAHVRGWDVGVKVHCSHVNGQDIIRVYRTTGSHNTGPEIPFAILTVQTSTLAPHDLPGVNL